MKIIRADGIETLIHTTATLADLKSILNTTSVTFLALRGLGEGILLAVDDLSDSKQLSHNSKASDLYLHNCSFCTYFDIKGDAVVINEHEIEIH